MRHDRRRPPKEQRRRRVRAPPVTHDRTADKGGGGQTTERHDVHRERKQRISCSTVGSWTRNRREENYARTLQSNRYNRMFVVVV